MLGFGLAATGSALFVWWMSIRGRTDRKNKGVLFLTIGVLPLICLLFTDQYLLGQMKKDEFCGSCHTMTPFVNGLEDTLNGGLAAMHTQRRWIRDNQCSSCHSDYGLLGGLKDKARGLKHLWAFYTHGSDERPKLYKPFPNRNCLSCHGGSARFESNQTHQALIEDLMQNKMSCLDCHGPSHRNAEDLDK